MLTWFRSLIASIREYRSGPSINFDPPSPEIPYEPKGPERPGQPKIKFPKEK